MIIHPASVDRKEGCLRLSADIEFERRPAWSGTLWFEVPAEMAPGYVDADVRMGQSFRLDPFAAAALVPAMTAGERLRIEGAVSPRLLEGMRRYQAAFSRFWPERCRSIEIEAAATLPPVTPSGSENAAVSAFSGGVDSFHSLIVRRGGGSLDSGVAPVSRPTESGGTAMIEPPLTHLLFVHGFDIPLSNRRTYEIAVSTYEKTAVEYGVVLIRAATNFRDTPFGRVVDWETSFVSLLAAVAQVMSPRFAALVIPSSGRFNPLQPLKSNPETDRMLSSESMRIIHDAPLSRVDKLRTVVTDRRITGALRVCWERPDGLHNCGRCEKCLRTMLALELLGRRDAFSTFPSVTSAELLARVRRLQVKGVDFISFIEELRELALTVGRQDAVQPLNSLIARAHRAATAADFLVAKFHLRGRVASLVRRACFTL